MRSPQPLCTVVAALCLAVSPVNAFILTFSNADFGTSPVFSTVETFYFEIDIAGPLQPGLYADPTINAIEYNVSGSLAAGTPSMFSGFVFQVSHLNAPPPASPESIPGTQFYSLNGGAVPGQTLRFEIAAGADLTNGLQLDELVDLGGGVVFRFNGRETGEGSNPGRYHPAFLELRSDGTGRIQNADNNGGVNPSTTEVVNVAFGEEYITDLTFSPSAFTIAVPEPGVALLLLPVLAALGLRRRRIA
ncbi:MAG: hypothetical protein AAGJ79_07520 [Verrucomicrobiota bacterium]